MSTFDPYRDWLGIQQPHRPLNAYELLGLPSFTHDAAALSQAAERQLARLKPHAAGPHAPLTQRLAQEVGLARQLLLTQTRTAYDAQLRQALAPAAATAMQFPQAMPMAHPAAGRAYGAPVFQQPQTQMFAPAVSSISRAATRRESSSAGLIAVAGLSLLLIVGAAILFLQRDKLLAKLQPSPATAPAAVVKPAKTAPSSKASDAFTQIGVQPAQPDSSSSLFGTVDPSFAPPSKAPATAAPASVAPAMTPATPATTPSEPSGLFGKVNPSFSNVDVSTNMQNPQPPTDASTPAEMKSPPATPTLTPPTTASAALTTETTSPPPAKAEERTAMAEARLQFFDALAKRTYDGALYQITQAQRVATTPQSLATVETMKLWSSSLTRFWEGVEKGIPQFQPGQVISSGNVQFEIKTLSSERISFWQLQGEKKIPRVRLVKDMSKDLLLQFAEKGLDVREAKDAVAVAAFLAVDPKGDRVLARRMLIDAGKHGAQVNGMLQDLDSSP